jgi:hypothetical protein
VLQLLLLHWAASPAFQRAALGWVSPSQVVLSALRLLVLQLTLQRPVLGQLLVLPLKHLLQFWSKAKPALLLIQTLTPQQQQHQQQQVTQLALSCPQLVQAPMDQQRLVLLPWRPVVLLLPLLLPQTASSVQL